MCDRLRLVLPHVVNDNQTAFIEGRLIGNNIIICQDLVRLYQRKKVSPRCLFKIELKKAYDSISWDFINQLLLKLKFPDLFRKWIITVIASCSYTVNLNGCNHGSFKGWKGLRQGDPLSLFIFVIVMDYLARTLQYIAFMRPVKFHPLCKNLKLLNLCFADDLMSFLYGKYPYYYKLNGRSQTL